MRLSEEAILSGPNVLFYWSRWRGSSGASTGERHPLGDPGRGKAAGLSYGFPFGKGCGHETWTMILHLLESTRHTGTGLPQAQLFPLHVPTSLAHSDSPSPPVTYNTLLLLPARTSFKECTARSLLGKRKKVLDPRSQRGAGLRPNPNGP